MTSQQITAAVRRHCEQNEITLATFSQAVGERFGLLPDTAASKIMLAERIGRMSEQWIDRLTVMLDLHEPASDVMQPGLDAHCPRCRKVQPSRSDGTCLWCDTQTGGNTVPNIVDRLGDQRKERRSSNAGYPWKCSEEQLHEVRRLYLSGLSMREACAQVHPGTDYTSPHAMAMAMYSLFENRGWNRRTRSDTVTERNFRHGLSRDPAHRRRLRLANGETRGVRCAGIKKNAPGVGKPCTRYARRGSDYCRQHDPRNAEENVIQMSRLRAMLGKETA